ncbi:MAG: hypothetical protein IAE80_04035 [Anaerolinea sp.]|nr:hypothetical protein [Anaerolinea sp.]
MMNPVLGLIGLPLLTSPLAYFAGRAAFPPSARRHAEYSRALALIGLLAVWLWFAWVASEVSRSGTLEAVVGTIALRVDGISLLLIAVVLTLTSVVVVYSGRYMTGEAGEEKYYALLIAMSGAMIGLACAADLFNLWLWFELMTISSFLLVAFYCQRGTALEAGVKYLLQSALGSVLVLLGIALTLAQTGSLTLASPLATESSGVLLAAGALFVIGFGIKIALVPLHMWLPDAHAQAPSGISAMLSGVVIEAGLIALLRVLVPLAGVAASWGSLLLAFGAINMLAGNLLALRQKQIKRLLAFSSIAHIGYIVFAFGVAFSAGSVEAAQGGFFHVLTHALMKGAAFLAAGALLFALYIRNGRHDALMISDLAGAAHRYPLTAFCLSLALLGLGGLPPLAGFMSKWQIFAAGFDTQQPVIMALVAFAALNSVLSLVYYAPLVNRMYREQPSSSVLHGKMIPITMRLGVVVLTLLLVVIGLLPSLVAGLTEPAGSALINALTSALAR